MDVQVTTEQLFARIGRQLLQIEGLTQEVERLQRELAMQSKEEPNG